MKARYLILILLAVLSYNTLMAQIITDSGYRTVGYIKSDGTIQDSGYHTVVHIKSDGTIQDASYKTIGHVKKDGTVQDSSYRTIGHAKNIPMEWAALYFSLENDNTKCL